MLGTAKDCSEWDDAVRKAEKCGVGCNCQRVKLNLNKFDHYNNKLNLWQNGMLSPEDITDQEYAYMIELSSAKERRKKFEEKMKEKFGKIAEELKK